MTLAFISFLHYLYGGIREEVFFCFSPVPYFHQIFVLASLKGKVGKWGHIRFKADVE